jgi:hypothetical protein
MQQLQKWNLEKLQEISRKIGDMEILMKKNSEIKNDILIKKLLINIFNKAITF